MIIPCPPIYIGQFYSIPMSFQRPPLCGGWAECSSGSSGEHWRTPQCHWTQQTMWVWTTAEEWPTISTQTNFQTNWNFLCRAQSELLARSLRAIRHQTCAFKGQRLSMESQRWLMTTMTMMIMMMTMMTMMILSLNENCHVDDHNTTPNLCIQRSRTIYGVSKVIDDHNDNDDQDDHDDYNDHDDYDDHDGQQTCAFKGQRLSM